MKFPRTPITFDELYFKDFFLPNTEILAVLFAPSCMKQIIEELHDAGIGVPVLEVDGKQGALQDGLHELRL